MSETDESYSNRIQEQAKVAVPLLEALQLAQPPPTPLSSAILQAVQAGVCAVSQLGSDAVNAFEALRDWFHPIEGPRPATARASAENPYAITTTTIGGQIFTLELAWSDQALKLTLWSHDALSENLLVVLEHKSGKAIALARFDVGTTKASREIPRASIHFDPQRDGWNMRVLDLLAEDDLGAR